MTLLITVLACLGILFGAFLWFVIQAEYSLYREERAKAEHFANWERHRGLKVEKKKSFFWSCWDEVGNWLKEISFWHVEEEPAKPLPNSALYKNTGNKTVENAAAAKEVYNRAISEKRMRNVRSLAEVVKEIREDQIIRGFEGLTAEELKQFDAERDEDTDTAARKEFFTDMPWDNVP